MFDFNSKIKLNIFTPQSFVGLGGGRHAERCSKNRGNACQGKGQILLASPLRAYFWQGSTITGIGEVVSGPMGVR